LVVVYAATIVACLVGISDIKVNPKDVEDTTKR
jgi:hypothetical protein